MKPPTQRAVFLARTTYRQRRLRDALRMLPILGVVLWLTPLLWGADETGSSRTGSAFVFVFTVWVLLIVLSAIFARFLSPDEQAEGES